MSAFLLLLLLNRPEPPSEDPRAELEQVKQLLFQNVQQVSRTSATHPMGLGEACRAYHIRGLGAFFVLAPRALPGRTGPFLMVETQPIPSPKPGEFAAALRRMQERRASPQRGSDPNEAEIRAMEEQVREFQQEAQRAHEEAERALERQIEQIQRIQAPPVSASPAPDVPPIPPWQGWFFSEERRDPRPPDVIVTDVENAVTAALEQGVSNLRIVSPDESLIVAVDFYAQGPFALPMPPARTLVVRAKKKDLSEAASGKIPPEELKKRVEYLEY